MNTYVIGHINAMQMFVQNFPLSLLDFFKGKKYDNMLDFILDVLYACGVDVEGELHKMLCKLFKVEDLSYFSPDILYEKLATTNMRVESKFLDGLEDAVKVAIIESLLAVLGGCSVVPEIKNEHMDKISYIKKGFALVTRNNKITREDDYVLYEKLDEGIISIPIDSIDIFGKLRISPLSSTGSCIYDLEKSPTYTAELAYSYYKITVNTSDGTVVDYFLNRAAAEQRVRDILNSEVKNAKENLEPNYYNVNNYIKERKAGFITDSLTSYNEALKAAGYIEKDEANGDLEKLYKLLSESNANYTKKSFYKKYVTMTPPYSPSELYTTKDFDAFLWYSMYRGSSVNQYERNKMMWDSRRTNETRTGEEWAYWLDSKNEHSPFLFQESDSGNFLSDSGIISSEGPVEEPFRYNYKGIFPIIQLERDPSYPSENRLAVSIASQRYYRGSGASVSHSKNNKFDNPGFLIRFNHTMYKFNYDYMRSIKIFNAKTILAGMLDELLNGSLLAGIGLNSVFSSRVIEAQISKIVKTAIERDDFLSADCYFTFSNDEYDMLLHRDSLNKYGAKDVGAPGIPVATVDVDEIVDSMNEANSSATPSGTVTTIQRTINDITQTPSSNAIVNYEGSLNGSHLMQFLYNIIMAIIKPIVMCLFAPKVMLIFILNFHIAGLIDLTDPNSISDVQNLILNKMFSIIKCLVKLLIQKIIDLLLELFYQYIKPILSDYIIRALIEYMEKWLKLLKEALQCIPMFNWDKYKIKAAIDTVDYADIIDNGSNIPQSSKTC